MRLHTVSEDTTDQVVSEYDQDSLLSQSDSVMLGTWTLWNPS